MNYIEYKVEVSEEVGEVVVASLAELGFESFIYDGNFQLCYIQEADYADYKTLIENYLKEDGYTYSSKLLEQQNWNAEWESDFEPITIGDVLAVRTPLHEVSGCKREILITPNMSFGTGHHPTTYMILSAMLAENFEDTEALDVGCGSGVLGIMAAMNGAKNVLGVDIDSWAAQSARDNLVLNNVNDKMQILDGDIKMALGNVYDFIFANIARNVLIDNMKDYASVAKSGAKLLLSGFLVKDSDFVQKSAEENGFTFVEKFEREGWNMLVMKKL